MAESKPKKICVVTGARAEYGLLSGVMQAIQAQAELELQVVACAAHLSEKHGMTLNQILADGFEVDAQVPMLVEGDDEYAITQSVGRGVIGFADAYRKLEPDILLILGDRYEILAAAQAALLMQIPIAHIHGGEKTEGAVDEAIRHAITKMASLHFAAAESYRLRIIQMGEQPDSVFNVGAPGLDRIRKLALLSETELQQDLGIHIDSPLFLVTYHPVTWGHVQGQVLEALQNLFAALETFEEATVVWTGANADADGEKINAWVQEWAAQTKLNVFFKTTLGSLRYLSLMKFADVVVGNSSSGIIEAPVMGTATVNIGDRQKGRLRSPSVIDCDESTESIKQALQLALSEEHQAVTMKKQSLYGSGDSANQVAEILSACNINKSAGKKFYDLPDWQPQSV
ncbi:UDP-N-acetylglucosamine 2-epimerase [Thiomicrorhabdus chilensis]|uniref:UDP-N-acetylglucosamine 2-epimerase n=1 Tax=Thiomicrorhabdus chilensis TaxID=63656 RepID=UPI0003F7DCF3|nr:UDP-N-acetylglucosamine 2-epimerase [Thiomicrorhabdus chilensis]